MSARKNTQDPEPVPDTGKTLTIDAVWEQMRADSKVLTESNFSDSNDFSMEEYETWWLLSGSGRDGKTVRGVRNRPGSAPVWTEEDTGKLLEVLVHASRDPNIRPSHAKKFLSQFGADAKWQLARQEGLPLVFFTALAKDSSSQVRELVAGLATDSSVLSLMRGERKENVARAMARNKNTPPDVLAELFLRFREKTPPVEMRTYHGLRWRENEVVIDVIENPYAPRSIAVEGYYSKDSIVFLGALRNPMLPADLLVEAWRESDVAAEKFKNDDSFQSGRYPDELIVERARANIVQNASCPEGVLHRALQSGETRALSRMWGNPNLSAHMVESLWSATEKTWPGIIPTAAALDIVQSRKSGGEIPERIIVGLRAKMGLPRHVTKNYPYFFSP